MVTALQQQLVAAPAKGLFYFLFVSIEIGDIGIGMARDAIEVTEFTIGDTDIGGIDIAINLPGHLAVRYLHLPQFVGHLHEFGQRGMREKKYSFFYVQKLSFQCLMV